MTQTKTKAKLFKVTDAVGRVIYVVALTAADACAFRQTQLDEIPCDAEYRTTYSWVLEVEFASHDIFLAPGAAAGDP